MLRLTAREDRLLGCWYGGAKVSRTRAFSDSEIVTIAAVAAGALGGIVVGLGRGQESATRTNRRSEQVTRRAESAVGAGRSLADATTEAILDESASRVRPAIQRAVADATPPSGPDLSNIVSTLSQRAGRQIAAKRSAASRRKGRGTMLTMVGEALGAIEASRRRSSNGSSDLPEIASLGRKIVEGLLTSEEDDEPVAASRPSALDRVSSEARAIEADIAVAPARLRSGAQQGAAMFRSRVATPVAQAASSTRSATQDSLAALAWLSIGAAVVYFGLLSDERREQVKSALCAAVEQARLLALDLQGYEPEM